MDVQFEVGLPVAPCFTLFSGPTLNPQPEEVLEVSCIRRNEDKVVDVRNGGNLPVDERLRPAWRAKPCTFDCVPIGGFAVVGKHWEAGQNNTFEIAFYRLRTVRLGEPCASEAQLVPYRRGDRRLGVMLAEPAHDLDMGLCAQWFRDRIGVE